MALQLQCFGVLANNRKIMKTPWCTAHFLGQINWYWKC